MEYSAFISYRHTALLPTYAEEFVKDLEDELAHKSRRHRIFFDKDRINGIIESTIAPALCKSVCMIVLFSPTYYAYDNHETPWCVQELAAFHDAEELRLSQLKGHLADGDCFIIPVLINADSKTLPSLIQHRIYHSHNLVAMSQLRKKKDSMFDDEYYQNIKAIANKIDDLRHKIEICPIANEEIFKDCEQVTSLPLKTHTKVSEILNQYQNFAPTEDLLM